MRRLLGIGLIVLGLLGVVLSVVSIGAGWWAAMSTASRLDSVANRLDRGLSEVDAQFAHVESRVHVVQAQLVEVRIAADTVAARDPPLPNNEPEIERLLGRLVPIFARADSVADSLRLVATALRTVADIEDQYGGDPGAADRTQRLARLTDDRAAVSMNGLAAKVNALGSAKADHRLRSLITISHEATAHVDRLAGGLATVRSEIGFFRQWVTKSRADLAFNIFIVAIASTIICLWGGVGQLCLIGWGWRLFARRTDRSQD